MGEHIELIWDSHLFQTLLTTGLMLSLEMFDGLFWEGDCFLGAVLGSCLLSVGVESDRKEVIDLCSNKKDPPSNTVSIIADIRCLASNWSSVIKRGLGVCLGDGQYLAAVFSGVKKELEKIEKNKEIKFSGVIPSSIGSGQMPTFLSLVHNKLEGFVPESLGKLINLELLDLSNNNLCEPIPKSFEGLRYIQYFNVFFNKLQGEIPTRGCFANFKAESFRQNDGLCGVPRLQVQPYKRLRSRN
ncbi:hypothetical protein LguiB_018055 [Lonicera macranthoides]